MKTIDNDILPMPQGEPIRLYREGGEGIGRILWIMGMIIGGAAIPILMLYALAVR